MIIREIPDIDWLAHVIHHADGDNRLGAGALAEKIVEALQQYRPADGSASSETGPVRAATHGSPGSLTVAGIAQVAGVKMLSLMKAIDSAGEGAVTANQSLETAQALAAIARVAADRGLSPPSPSWCEVHQSNKWCEHNGGVMGKTGWEAPDAPSPQRYTAEPVGEAGPMPGTAGFTIACFKAADVPIGTKLYAAPSAQPEAPADPKRLARRLNASRLLERILRNTLGDEDCAEYLEALDTLAEEQFPPDYYAGYEAGLVDGIESVRRGIAAAPQAPQPAQPEAAEGSAHAFAAWLKAKGATITVGAGDEGDYVARIDQLVEAFSILRGAAAPSAQPVAPSDALRWALGHCGVRRDAEGGAFFNWFALAKLAGLLAVAPSAQPVAWLRDQRDGFEGPQTLNPLVILSAADPGKGLHGATYSPVFLAAAPSAQPEAVELTDEGLLKRAEQYAARLRSRASLTSEDFVEVPTELLRAAASTLDALAAAPQAPHLALRTEPAQPMSAGGTQ